MSDIRNQLIKDSYNFVLQSDLTTGVVYRIGGDVPINPIFQSGLTVSGGFTYSGAGEQIGYALLTDGTGYAYWGPVSATTPSSGVTSITVGNGLSANSSTGAVTIVFTGSTGISGDYLPLSGGTVTGGTIFTNGLTANTISATTYLNLPISGLSYYVSAATPTGVTLISGDRWFNTATGIELVWINDGDSTQWIQPFSVPGPVSPDVGYHTVTGITSGQTLTWDKTYWGISAQTNVNLTLPTTTGKDGYYIIIKDEGGYCGSYRIRLTPASGLIDGNNYVDMNINYMSLTCMVRGSNWYLI